LQSGETPPQDFKVRMKQKKKGKEERKPATRKFNITVATLNSY
jgi:hypothetical protein